MFKRLFEMLLGVELKLFFTFTKILDLHPL